jgi:hypothetical protein
MKIDTHSPRLALDQIPRCGAHDPEHMLRDHRAGPLALTIASTGIGHIVAAGVFVWGDLAAAALCLEIR